MNKRQEIIAEFYNQQLVICEDNKYRAIAYTTTEFCCTPREVSEALREYNKKENNNNE